MLYEYNSLVWKYINGEDIDNIDELENDYKFMMKVICASRDKNTYYLCSEEIKSNYEFIRNVIDAFKFDKDFVHKVATDFLSKIHINDDETRELYFIMADIFNNYRDERSMFYNKRCFEIYTSDRDLIDKLVLSEKDNNNLENIDMGFSYVVEYIACQSDIISRYYAKRFLNDIFFHNDKMTTEELFHSEIGSLDELKNTNIRNFILGYIKKCDLSLYTYTLTHLDLIKEIESYIHIDRIISNWNNFVNQTLERKNIIFQQEVNNLIGDYCASFDYFDVCIYIDRNLNLPVKLSIIDMDEFSGINIDKISLMEYECLRKIIMLASDLYGSPVIDKDFDFSKLDKKVNREKGRKKVFKFKKDENGV